MTGATGTVPVLSILDMPLPRTEKAPRKFKGEYVYVKEFLQHYERLLNQCKITDDAEKCTGILQYCSKTVKETIEGLEDYQKPNWNQLKTTLLRLYDSERNDKRHSERELKAFINHTKGADITHLSQFRNYERHFMRIAGWLKGQGKLTDSEMNKRFWSGLPRNLRKQIELRMSIDDPPLDLTTPFSIDKIVTAAERILHRDRFDADESDGQEMDWAEDDSDSDSDSDDEYTQIKAKVKNEKKSNHNKKAKKALKDLDEEGEEIKRRAEVETLIQQLAQMSVSDSNYGLLYYRAISRDPKAQLSIKPPQLQLTKVTKNPDTSQKPSNTGLRTSFGCYGCGAQDHGMSNCSALNDLVIQGMIKRGTDNKYIMKDGSKIFRNSGETFLEAAQRLNKSNRQSTNYVAIGEENFVNTVHNSYAAQKQVKKFDGVYPPTITKSKARQKDGKQVTEPPSKTRQEPIPTVVPIDVHERTPNFDPENDQDIIEDISSDKTKTQRKPRMPYASTVSSEVDPVDISKKILSTPVTLTVGQIAGASKEVSSSLLQLLKYKKVSTPESDETVNQIDNDVTHHVQDIHSSSQGVLIKIKMEINDVSLKAIIDTGSTCNIMHYNVFKMLGLPIDKTVTPIMSDANGGGKVMVGLVKNVSLLCGSVDTKADIFVATHIPFDLLLGRPWQRGNYVSIDERHDGTYVVFKSPFDPAMHYELLGVPEPLYSEYETNTQTWNVPDNVLPSEHSIFYSKKQSQKSSIYNQDILSPLSSMEMLNFPEWSTEEQDLECQARSCQGSVKGQRPKSEYVHKVMFHDAYDEDDTVLYQVCKSCHVGCKRKSQGGSLISAKKIKRDICYAIWVKPDVSQKNNYDFEENDSEDTEGESEYYDVQECNKETYDQVEHDYDTCDYEIKKAVSVHSNSDCINNQDRKKDETVSIYSSDDTKSNQDNKEDKDTVPMQNNKNNENEQDNKGNNDTAPIHNSKDNNDDQDNKINEDNVSIYKGKDDHNDQDSDKKGKTLTVGQESDGLYIRHSEEAVHADRLHSDADSSHDQDNRKAVHADRMHSNADSSHDQDNRKAVYADRMHSNADSYHDQDNRRAVHADRMHSNADSSHDKPNKKAVYFDRKYSNADRKHSNADRRHSNADRKHSNADKKHSNADRRHSNAYKEHSKADSSWRGSAPSRRYKNPLRFYTPPQTSPMKIMTSPPPINLPQEIPTPVEPPSPDEVYSYADLWTDSLLQISQGQHDGRSYQDFLALYADLDVTDEAGWGNGPSYGGSAFIRIYDEPLWVITTLSREDSRAVPGTRDYGAITLPAGTNRESYLSFAQDNPGFLQRITTPVFNKPMPSIKPYTFTTSKTTTHPPAPKPIRLVHALNKAAKANGALHDEVEKKKRRRKRKRFPKKKGMAQLEKDLFGPLSSDEEDTEVRKASSNQFQEPSKLPGLQTRVKLWLNNAPFLQQESQEVKISGA